MLVLVLVSGLGACVGGCAEVSLMKIKENKPQAGIAEIDIP